MLPAIALIGASNGSRPRSSSTVSYATAVVRLASSALVSAGGAPARWKYANRILPAEVAVLVQQRLLHFDDELGAPKRRPHCRGARR